MISPIHYGGRGADRAFTLVELLTVIVIIAILSGITFGVVRGVSDKGRVARAQSEMAALSSALEEYRRQFGDYLRLDSNTEDAKDDDQIDPTPEENERYQPTRNDRAYNLFRALNGRIAPDRSVLKRQINKSGGTAEKYGRAFVNPSLFTLERTEKTSEPANVEVIPAPETSATADDPDFANAFLDPWGNRYIYFYKDDAAPKKWKRDGFMLLSAGPDGKVKFNVPGDRQAGDPIDADDTVNRDNIYLNP